MSQIEPEPDDNHGLPQALPEEKLRELTDNLSNQARKMGLYTMGYGVNTIGRESEDEDEEPTEYNLVMQFQVGDVAFAPRIQDPETDQMNDEFRKIQMGTLDDDINDIKNRYLKDKDEDAE